MADPQMADPQKPIRPPENCTDTEISLEIRHTYPNPQVHSAK